MNPGLVVKLRPSGPWRIGPDSGARNRVDAIYHSDSLYSAVTSAMARLGALEDWLDATARHPDSAVRFSSCFPFVDEIGLVVPPRTVWPPTSPALMSARVRWKSARFVPLSVVQSILAGQPPHEEHWAVDGPSECLVPAGRHGPFRTGVRWSAAVDRLTGASERHSTACLEFRPGCGLWTVIAFRDSDARYRWLGPVKSAFRLLADSGFGGERSRGWGRSEPPEFIEGTLPEMILPPRRPEAPQPEPPATEPQVAQAVLEPVEEVPPFPGEEAYVPELLPPPQADAVGSETIAGTPDSGGLSTDTAEGGVMVAVEAESSVAALEVEELPEVVEAPTEAEPVLAPAAEQLAAADAGPQAHWLLSLFTPAPADSIDWRRGNYTVLARGGRVESPAGSGEHKKQLHMVTEGSVVYAAAAPCGSAVDVGPDGFAHPVFRAGFALAIPLAEVS